MEGSRERGVGETTETAGERAVGEVMEAAAGREEEDGEVREAREVGEVSGLMLVPASEALMETAAAEPGVEGGVDLRCRMMSSDEGRLD